MGAKCLKQGPEPETMDLRDREAQGPAGEGTSIEKDPKKAKTNQRAKNALRVKDPNNVFKHGGKMIYM
jgi:hypothetical protein